MLKKLFALIVLAAFFSCGGAKSSPPKIISFDATRTNAEVGEKIEITAVFTDGEGRVEPDIGVIFSGKAVTVEAIKTTDYSLVVNGKNGETVKSTLRLNVKPGMLFKIEGLPQTIKPIVTITGPNGFIKTIDQNTAITGLKVGSYKVLTTAVNDGTISRHPIWLRRDFEIIDTGVLIKIIYPESSITISLPGNIPLEFVLIPAGNYFMGPLYPDQTLNWPKGGDIGDSSKFALPRHEVEIPKAFYLAKYPITIRQWKAVMGWTIPDFENKDPDVPVWGRTWIQTRLEFIPALTKSSPNNIFRLPSESEWEYALRAGSQTKYFWGNDFSEIDKYAWTYNTTVAVGNNWPKVGLKLPNAYGLHDMFSVFQWTEDDSHPNYQGAPTSSSPWVDNPRSPWGVARGSTWSILTDPDQIYYFDAANRGLFESTKNNPIAGIRIALDFQEK